MKKHSKVGNRKGLPAYRTPSTFISKKSLGNVTNRSKSTQVFNKRSGKR
jgi:hypothetical protein